MKGWRARAPATAAATAAAAAAAAAAALLLRTNSTPSVEGYEEDQGAIHRLHAWRSHEQQRKQQQQQQEDTNNAEAQQKPALAEASEVAGLHQSLSEGLPPEGSSGEMRGVEETHQRR